MVHEGWEDTLQKWYDWLSEMWRKDEVKKMEVGHLKKVSQMIKSAEGSAGPLHKITKPTAKKTPNRWPNVKRRGNSGTKHWQCDAEVQYQGMLCL